MAIADLFETLTVKLDRCEREIETAERNSYLVRGRVLAEIRDDKLYRERYQTFEAYCDERWEITDRHARYLIDAAAFAEKVELKFRPARETHIRPLLELETEEDRSAVWREVLDAADGQPRKVKAADVESAVERRRAVVASRYRKLRQPPLTEAVSLAQWHTLDAEDRVRLLRPDEELIAASPSRFNEQTGPDIEWAHWSANVITGCEHTCSYCYAREIANSERMSKVYPYGFEPTLHPRRLLMPRFMKVPAEAVEDIRYRNVFLGSMADMFGRWVPPEWIEAVIAMVREAPEWNFLCLTKFPKRMAEFDIPDNMWMGTTVDLQARVNAAEEAFARIESKVRWLSCEPLLEQLKFKHLKRFNWIVIGGASKTENTPAWRPPIDWINDLTDQARAAGLKIYDKTNLWGWRRLELPFGPPIISADNPSEAPAVFHYLRSL